MVALRDFLQIAGVEGVDKYIFLDSRGKILVNTMKHPATSSTMVFNCGRNLSLIGRSNFKYVVFSKRDGKNILIFPVGKYTLGVVKQQGIKNQVVADAVLVFLNILRKKAYTKGEDS
ncbi:hypothetical protein SAMN02746065_10782 [Desulfocicer vacuolatum DSM 3385]|uniref:Roadblock/LC7 domain-containing protein n=1 Tax=Desulfocicer vacuolatum DSM 3385 TaxID=1121400 RepID=A0A1W2B8K0_9BACT|nr:hypothetical protein [Desulfocicer vacuolatum]SMC69110.1 hypothetical protein SAMN02746065_10782 [Desulfocicer vacuolatum DSM 3385]